MDVRGYNERGLPIDALCKLTLAREFDTPAATERCGDALRDVHVGRELAALDQQNAALGLRKHERRHQFEQID